jgi:hypothetical protein
MEKKYQIVTPQTDGCCEEQLNSCIQQIDSQNKNNWHTIKLTFFVSAANDTHYIAIKSTVKQNVETHFGHYCPTFAVVAQPPMENHAVLVEACFVDTTGCAIKFGQVGKNKYVVLTQGNRKELWASGLGSDHRSDATEISADTAFNELKQIIETEQLTFDHIVRQWNYIAQILSIDASVERQYQHYQLFNEARSRYYNTYRQIKGYPAATGIGTQAGGVIIDIYAVNTVSESEVAAIDNPLQCLPYKYSQSLLEGDAPEGKNNKQPPQFERAKLVNHHQPATIFVSGTAAIVGERTIGIDDVAQQTSTTIHHIQQLLSVENLIFHRIEVPQLTLEQKAVRVYIKDKAHYEKVKRICDQSFNPHITLFVQADVCRDNLLVEIEAEYALVI